MKILVFFSHRSITWMQMTFILYFSSCTMIYSLSYLNRVIKKIKKNQTILSDRIIINDQKHCIK